MTGRASLDQCRQVEWEAGPLVIRGDGAGGAGRGHRVLGYQGGEGGDVSSVVW